VGGYCSPCENSLQQVIVAPKSIIGLDINSRYVTRANMVRTRRQIGVDSEMPVGSDGGNLNQHDAMKENESSSNLETKATFQFQGKKFSSYEEMVKAKRQRNVDMLKSSGLLEASAKLREVTLPAKKEASKRGLRPDRKRKEAPSVTVRRKSSRLAGEQSDGIFVEDERRGGIVILGGSSGINNNSNAIVNNINYAQDKDEFFNGRINDGSDLSVMEAIEKAGPKWVDENSVSLAQQFVSSLKNECVNSTDGVVVHSPKSIVTREASLMSQVQNLTLEDESCVAKVVPDRIYSVAFHPSPHKVIAVAGDKKGHVGLWDVDASSQDNNGVHLFKPHNHPISNVQWNSNGSKLLTSSYGGSIRIFDLQQERFIEHFATYDNSVEYKNKLGFDLLDGWMQFSCLDHRNEDCFFYSTSYGDVVHIDMRKKSKITFNENLSAKKINSVSLHPNGNHICTAGLDCNVNIWDVRNLKSSKSMPLVTQHSTKSINSAFFSPSGRHLLTTTMADNIDIITDAHLQTGVIKNPTHRIRHNNKTGRWLSTFMAQWHPSTTGNEDLFVVGSMQQPRTLEIFDGNRGELVRGVQGNALSAVVSRCCFHPSSNKLICAGGNSSGRVTIAR